MNKFSPGDVLEYEDGSIYVVVTHDDMEITLNPIIEMSSHDTFKRQFRMGNTSGFVDLLKKIAVCEEP